MTSTDLFSLEGKTAIITGGSRGLGREMALAFAEHGANIVVASRKVENCESVAEEVRALGRRALALGYHAASWDDAGRLANEAIAEFGRIDILVNNAGMSPLYSSLVDVTEDLYDKVLGVNLKGPFRLSTLLDNPRRRQCDSWWSNHQCVLYLESASVTKRSDLRRGKSCHQHVDSGSRTNIWTSCTRELHRARTIPH
jgi:NAD(P)-dependent dehydrogenase (short-subunit alcohol dehydrogenase family)